MILLKQGRLLGQGAYGKVYALKTLKNEKTNLIAKTFQLNEHSFNQSRHLSSMYNEYTALKHLNRLRGVQQHNNQLWLTYEKQKGEIAKNSQLKNKNWLCFKALRELHRQQLAHLDPHTENFIIDKKQHQAKTIDFGYSQEAGWLNCSLDCYYFFCARNFAPVTMLRFLIAEQIQYCEAHKLSLAINLLGGAIIIFGSFYGMPFLGLSPALFEALSNTLFFGTLIQEMLSKATEHLLAFTLSKMGFHLDFIQRTITVFHYIKTLSALLFLHYIVVANGNNLVSAYRRLDHAKFINPLTTTLSGAMHGLCCFFPLQQITQTTRKFLTDPSMPASVLKRQNKMLLKFSSQYKVVGFDSFDNNNDALPNPHVKIASRSKNRF